MKEPVEKRCITASFDESDKVILTNEHSWLSIGAEKPVKKVVKTCDSRIFQT
jgi:hypothetical protein